MDVAGSAARERLVGSDRVEELSMGLGLVREVVAVVDLAADLADLRRPDALFVGVLGGARQKQQQRESDGGANEARIETG